MLTHHKSGPCGTPIHPAGSFTSGVGQHQASVEFSHGSRAAQHSAPDGTFWSSDKCVLHVCAADFGHDLRRDGDSGIMHILVRNAQRRRP